MAGAPKETAVLLAMGVVVVIAAVDFFTSSVSTLVFTLTPLDNTGAELNVPNKVQDIKTDIQAASKAVSLKLTDGLSALFSYDLPRISSVDWPY